MKPPKPFNMNKFLEKQLWQRYRTKWYDAVAIGFLSASTMLFLYEYFNALVTECKCSKFYINTFGELSIEMSFIIILSLISLYALYKNIRKWRN